MGLGEDIPNVLPREPSCRRQVAYFSGCERQIRYLERTDGTLPALFPRGFLGHAAMAEVILNAAPFVLNVAEIPSIGSHVSFSLGVVFGVFKVAF